MIARSYRYVPLTMALAALCFGCNGTRGSQAIDVTHGKSKTIAYILPNEGYYYDLKWHGLREELATRGYIAERFSAKAYANQREQFELIESQIARGVAGIVLHPVNSRSVVPFVEEAIAKRIPVVAENLDVESEKVSGRVMLANYEIGYELAMSIVRLTGGKGKVAALVGPPGQAQAREMWRAARDYFSKFPGIHVVREEELPANATAGQEAAQSILAAEPDLAAIYTWYVENAVGAAKAAKRASAKPGQVVIVAKDISDEGERLLREGYISELLVGEPIEMGRKSARLIHQIATGQPVENRTILMRNFLVTAANVDSIDRSGFEVARGR